MIGSIVFFEISVFVQFLKKPHYYNFFFFIIPKLTILNRAIGAYDVSINIAFCGVCYADVAWTRNKMGTSKYPLVPGYVDLFDYAIVILVKNYVEDIVSPPHMPPFYFIFSN